MAEIREIEIDGVKHRAVELPYEIDREDWAEYKFADGDRARVKTTVIRMFQVIDGDNKPVRRPNGDRAIIVEHETTAVFSD